MRQVLYTIGVCLAVLTSCKKNDPAPVEDFTTLAIIGNYTVYASEFSNATTKFTPFATGTINIVKVRADAVVHAEINSACDGYSVNYIGNYASSKNQDGSFTMVDLDEKTKLGTYYDNGKLLVLTHQYAAKGSGTNPIVNYTVKLFAKKNN